MASERLQVILELVTGNYQREARQAAQATGQIGTAARGVNKPVATATSAISGLSGAVKNFAGPAAIVGAGVAVASFARDSIMAASDLEESINAVTVVYGEAAEGVLALGENSVESLGMSQQALNEFSVRFSAFAENIAGQSGRDVVEVVDEMTTRLADFASVHNMTMEEAATIAQSTLAGETEAFRRFGGDVSAAAVELKGLEMGLGSSSAELTEQEKILIRYQLFMEQTAETAGDFNNTSDSTANTLRRLNARLTETKARVGQALMPAFQSLLGLAEDLAPAFEDFATEIAGVVSEVKPLLELLGGLVSLYSDVKGWTDDAAGSTNVFEQQLGRVVDLLTSGGLGILGQIFNEFTPAAKIAGEKANEVGDGLKFMADATKDDLIPALSTALDPMNRVDRSFIDAKLNAIAAGKAFRNELAEDYRQAAVSIDKTSDAMAVSLDEIERRLLDNIQDQAEFYSNLLALAEAGMDDLANFLRGQGAAVAGGAAADLVDDLGRALNLENVIETADRDARAVTDALANALESSKTRLLEIARSIGIDINHMIRQGLLGTTFTTKDIINTLGAGLGAPGPIVNAPTLGGTTTVTIPRFQHGGIIPGQRGSEQLILAHGGETVLPTHKMGRPQHVTRHGPTINLQATGYTQPDLQYAAIVGSVLSLVENY